MLPWIGLWEVRSAPECDVLGGALGAFVNVVGLSSNEKDFLRLVYEALLENDLEVLNVKDVQTVRDRGLSGALSPEVTALVDVLTEEFPIQFDEFQAYLD